ncbi:MAG: type II secretion system protein GspL [Pseudomonadota bacterium]
MSLVIILDPDDLAQVPLWIDRESGEHGTDTPLDSLAERAAAQPKGGVCVALPGESVLSRTMRLPMKRKRDLTRAANLALDDAQAAVIDDRLVALGPENEGARLVTAVSRTLIEEVLATAHEAGIDPDRITVDHALLPQAEEGGAVILRLSSRACVRTPEGAFTAEISFADEMLALAGGAGDEVEAADLMDPLGAPNFREGPLAKRRPLPNLKPFALAASLAAVAGFVFLIGTLTEGFRYSGAAKAYRAEAEASFTRAFPGTPVVDIERQLRSRGTRTVVRSDFLPLAAILADVLSQEDRTRITSLSYDADGQLTAELTFGSFPDLERVTAALADRGVIAEEGSDARSDGDGAFVTQLFLRAG